MSGADQDAAAVVLQQHRALLFTVAYELLGSAADAEDVVQEVWLRWRDVDQAQVRDARAYLVRITTRLGLNRLRSKSRLREDYVGPWLPEPLLTTPDVAEDVELAESVSSAMLLVLETLTPVERAVFVLREVFGEEYADIAAAVDKSEAAVRQVAHRARSHVAARRPRSQVTTQEQLAVIERFRQAAAAGDLQGLMDVLAPDVVLLTDGGGQRKAALRPILGREKVLRFFLGVSGQFVPVVEVVTVNGGPALVLRRPGEHGTAGEIDTVITWSLEDGVATSLYAVRNPDKLRRLDQVTALTR